MPQALVELVEVAAAPAGSLLLPHAATARPSNAPRVDAKGEPREGAFMVVDPDGSTGRGQVAGRDRAGWIRQGALGRWRELPRSSLPRARLRAAE